MVLPNYDNQEKELRIAELEYGPSVINGLNLLVAIAKCKLSEPAVRKVVSETAKQTEVTCGDVFGYMNDAVDYISGINKIVEAIEVDTKTVRLDNGL